VLLRFADATKLFAAVTDIHAIESLRSDLRRLHEWSNDWLMSMVWRDRHRPFTKTVVTLKAMPAYMCAVYDANICNPVAMPV